MGDEGRKEASKIPCIWLERQLYVRTAELNETDRNGEGGQGRGSQATLRFPPNSHHTCVSAHLRSTGYKNRTELPEVDGGGGTPPPGSLDALPAPCAGAIRGVRGRGTGHAVRKTGLMELAVHTTNALNLYEPQFPHKTAASISAESSRPKLGVAPLAKNRAECPRFFRPIGFTRPGSARVPRPRVAAYLPAP